MCKVDIIPQWNAEGTMLNEHRRYTRCSAYNSGLPCDEETFRHPPPGRLPPSPRLTPRSTTPNYRSGDESGSSSGSRRRRPGVYVEVNGQRIYQGHPRRRPSHSGDRVVIVEGPPTPRTPPQGFTMPHTAPPSPSFHTPHHRLGHRPVIVDERTHHPRPHVTIAPPEYITHRRTPSNSSHHSRGSSASDEDRRWRAAEAVRRAEQQRRVETEEALRQQRLAARIAAANAEIDRRPAVPMAAGPQRATTPYVRPGVAVRPTLGHEREAEIIDAVRHLDLNRQSVRRVRQMDEDEAQKQRLKERMTPQRRATVGPANRRTRVVYPDGMYRWE